MLTTIKRRFGILSNFFGILNPSTTGVIIGGYPPGREIPDHQPITRTDTAPKLQSTTLPNGVRIVTESTRFPGNVRFGVTIDAGTRDETAETSGVVNALRQTFLKTNVRTNEQINYCMIQSSGGAFSMEFNQEFMNYQGHCLAHDFYDMNQMLADCVLDEKTLIDEEAAQWRTDEKFRLDEYNLTLPKKIENVWLSTAYGYKGFGNPLMGHQAHFQSIGFFMLNNWRKATITPDRIVVWGAGIDKHEEFVNTVTDYYRFIDPIKAPKREPSVYLGGEFREICDSPLTHVSLSFKGFSRSQPERHAACVLKYLIGQSNTGLFNRAHTNFHQKNPWLVYVDPHHETFQDSGNFRINVAAPNEKAAELSEALVKELRDLQNVTDEEVVRAKQKLKRATYNKYQDPDARMIKLTREFAQTGELKGYEDFEKNIESVTTDQVRKAAAAMLKSYPTVVVLGGNPHGILSAQSFQEKLR
ncbi:unnamed protein product [Blepharisma stoltei]|uniref:Mitochondrial processing peptidase n=1 Tax=Blepharisma stoltei TaxID=1481888 RepID=A0AAU9J581_9CILI|nr:unnamed protein product [Blepharisma stoltei]